MEHRSKYYQEYLDSASWKERAEAEKRRVGWKCQMCGHEDRRLDVHHRCYERLGMEQSADLIVLCPGCHAAFHSKPAPARTYFAESKDCPACGGDGDCSNCHGYGYIDDDNCDACYGKGKCQVCGGKGTVMEIDYEY